MEFTKKNEKICKANEAEAQGFNIDVDYQVMIERNLFKEHMLEKHTTSEKMKLSVCIRKRPIFSKEKVAGEIDAVSCANPQIKVLFPKVKVDGITKYIDEYLFTFDNTFNENEKTDDLYDYSLKQLIKDIPNQGFVTMFAYGQTGSGKTFTMKGITDSCVKDLFDAIKPKGGVAYISFFEIYGGKCLDLLNNHNRVQILEDQNNVVQIQGLSERMATTPKEMSSIIDSGHNARTTHSTVANDTSSRSHAICQVVIRDANKYPLGKLIMCDLAGSERAQDTQSNDRQRRLEGAEINKSLLALKECIRAMNAGSSHIPFRASKLTLALRDSFLSSKVNTHIVMIACICPGSSSADHTVNTLRYADRLKSKANRNFDPKDAVFFKKDGAMFEEADDDDDLGRSESPPPARVPLYQMDRIDEANNRRGGRENSAPKRENSSKKKEPTKKEAPAAKVQSQAKIKPLPPRAVHQPYIPEADDSDEFESKRESNQKKKAKDDMQILKTTLRMQKEETPDKDDGLGEEVFEYQEKVGDVLDMHDEILALHMNILKEDANFLSQETDIYSKAQKDGFDDDLEQYIDSLENIVSKKIHLYTQLAKKIGKFKKALVEEEEIHSKVRGTFYY